MLNALTHWFIYVARSLFYGCHRFHGYDFFLSLGGSDNRKICHSEMHACTPPGGENRLLTRCIVLFLRCKKKRKIVHNLRLNGIVRVSQIFLISFKSATVLLLAQSQEIWAFFYLRLSPFYVQRRTFSGSMQFHI